MQKVSKNVYAIVAVIALVVVTGTLALLANDSDADPVNQVEPRTEKIDTQYATSSTDNPLSIDLDVYDSPFRVTFEISDQNTAAIQSISEVDGNGNVNSTVFFDGEASSFIYLDGITYTKSPAEESWTQSAAESEGGSLFRAEEFYIGYRPEDIVQLKKYGVTQKSNERCGGSMCRVYESVNFDDNTLQVIKVDDTHNRIHEITHVTADSTETEETVLTISYDYSAAVNISAPDEFVTVEAQSSSPESLL